MENSSPFFMCLVPTCCGFDPPFAAISQTLMVPSKDEVAIMLGMNGEKLILGHGLS